VLTLLRVLGAALSIVRGLTGSAMTMSTCSGSLIGALYGGGGGGDEDEGEDDEKRALILFVTLILRSCTSRRSSLPTQRGSYGSRFGDIVLMFAWVGAKVVARVVMPVVTRVLGRGLLVVAMAMGEKCTDEAIRRLYMAGACKERLPPRTTNARPFTLGRFSKQFRVSRRVSEKGESVVSRATRSTSDKSQNSDSSFPIVQGICLDPYACRCSCHCLMSLWCCYGTLEDIELERSSNAKGLLKTKPPIFDDFWIPR
jgi:hypothetical protein